MEPILQVEVGRRYTLIELNGFLIFSGLGQKFARGFVCCRGFGLWRSALAEAHSVLSSAINRKLRRPYELIFNLIEFILIYFLYLWFICDKISIHYSAFFVWKLLVVFTWISDRLFLVIFSYWSRKLSTVCHETRRI